MQSKKGGPIIYFSLLGGVENCWETNAIVSSEGRTTTDREPYFPTSRRYQEPIANPQAKAPPVVISTSQHEFHLDSAKLTTWGEYQPLCQNYRELVTGALPFLPVNSGTEKVCASSHYSGEHSKQLADGQFAPQVRTEQNRSVGDFLRGDGGRLTPSGDDCLRTLVVVSYEDIMQVEYIVANPVGSSAASNCPPSFCGVEWPLQLEHLRFK